VVSYGDNYAPGFNKPAFTYDHSYTGNNNKISITCILCSDDAITGNNNVITLRNNNYIWNSGSADYFSDNNLAITGHNNSITNNGTTTVTP
jgi:hypothetical protein